MSNPTGYGPRPRFCGDEKKYEIWEVKFKAYLRLQKLADVLNPVEDDEENPVPGTDDVTRNGDLFAELIQCLDDRSVSLIIRDADGDGRKAFKVLREHYRGVGKPRVISLYTELTTLSKSATENCTDYIIRAETAATALRSSGEVISDGLLIAMVLKGLPENYKTFSTVVCQKDKQMSFSEFKTSLKSFEETEKFHVKDDKLLKVESDEKGDKRKFSGSCFKCGKFGHKSSECKSNGLSKSHKRWCEVCKSSTHDTKFCRKLKHNANKAKETEDDVTYAFNVRDGQPTDGNLLVDCGATTHIVYDKSRFVNFDSDFNATHHSIELADGSRASGIVQGKGKALFKITDASGILRTVTLDDALYIPSYNQNILSVHAATEKGARVNFSPNSNELIAPDNVSFKIEKLGKLYFLYNVCYDVNCSKGSLYEWHKKLGHCNQKDVLKLENYVEGMKITDRKEFDCEVCAMGKMNNFRNHNSDERAKSKLDVVYCDLAGPIDPIAKGGYRYVVSFVDDYSSICSVYFIQHKSEVTSVTTRFLADCAPFGKVKVIRTDNGTEFTCRDFRDLMSTNKIKHEFSAPYSPHQNGTVERGWRTLFDMARCLLIEAKLGKDMWPFAVRYAAFTRNRCFNPRLNKTPYEAMTGKRPNVSKLHEFGIICYAYVQNTKKLDNKGEKGIFVGYDHESPAYLVYCENSQIKKVRCVKFIENPYEDVSEKCVERELYDECVIRNNRPVDMSNASKPCTADDSKTNDVSRYPVRLRQKPSYLDDYVTGNQIDSVNISVDYCYKIVSGIPVNYDDAVNSNDDCLWRKAMNEEIDSLIESETYDLVPYPKNCNVVEGKWVYEIKSGPDGDKRYKARYVAKGYSQVENVDYFETYAPTARITSIRMLMQISVQYDLFIHQMDVKNAYLNADIDCEIFVEQPKGFERQGKGGERLVCKLKKSLYGLKQSGRNWNYVLHKFLVDNNFERSLVDPCVYFKNQNVDYVVLIVWVDDIIIASNNLNEIDLVKNSLKANYKMKDLGVLRWFLGIEFNVKKDVITMCQNRYIEKIVSRFGMQYCKDRVTPCEMGLDKIIDCESQPADGKLYREIVGSLIYAMCCTRTDISYIVNKLSQNMINPTNVHLSIAKHVLRYLSGTKDYCIVYRKSNDDLKLSGMCDADWAGSKDRHSISGFGFRLKNESALISWSSKRQPIVALSSCEAEYVALASAVQEAKFLFNLFNDLCSFKLCNDINVFVDNQGAISLAKNPINHKRSKHIDIRYHFIREEVMNGFVKLNYVPTGENFSDTFTKPVSKLRLTKFLKMLIGN